MGIRSANAIIDQIIEIVSKWSEYAKNADVNKEHALRIGNNLRLLN